MHKEDKMNYTEVREREVPLINESERPERMLSQDKPSTSSNAQDLKIQGKGSVRTSYLQEHDVLATQNQNWFMKKKSLWLTKLDVGENNLSNMHTYISRFG